MADVIEEARTSIEGRLKELEREAGRLRQALTGLDRGSSGKRGRRRTGSAASSTAARKASRARRGQREAEFLAAVRAKPGSKVPEIAREMGAGSNQVYGLAKRLHAAGKVTRRRGGGYVAKAGS